MNNQRKIGLFAGVILFMLLLVWMFSSSEERPATGDQYFSSSNWEAQYQPFDKNPRGTFLFHRILQAHIGKKDVYVAETSSQLDSILNMKKNPKTYLFVGKKFGLQTSEIDSLVADIERGSDLFLSFHLITSNIAEKFFEELDFRNDYSDFQNVYTPRGCYEMVNIYEKDTIAENWLAFGDVITKGNSKSLSSFMEMDNFIVIQMGKGKVYLQTNPNMFFNYQVKRYDGFRYTNYVIDYLSQKRDIVLLELGRLPDEDGNSEANEKSTKEGKKDDSYLKFILENPYLRTALILLILGVILYVIFRSKRKRPTVPVIQEQKDMTLAFAETITSIYFAKRSPYGLLQVQRKNFYATIQKHYFLDLNRREGDRELRMLAEKSNRSLEEIQIMVGLLETKEVTKVNDQTITEVAQKQRAFYKEAGIIGETVEERTKRRTLVFRRGLLLPTFLILVGVLLILFRLFLLVGSKGAGIALWPIGIAMVFLGVMRIANPYFIVTAEKIIYYSEFGRKREYERSRIVGTKPTKKGVIITLKNNEQLIINYWDMSSFDRQQFERFISKVHTLEL